MKPMMAAASLHSLARLNAPQRFPAPVYSRPGARERPKTPTFARLPPPGTRGRPQQRIHRWVLGWPPHGCSDILFLEAPLPAQVASAPQFSSLRISDLGRPCSRASGSRARVTAPGHRVHPPQRGPLHAVLRAGDSGTGTGQGDLDGYRLYPGARQRLAQTGIDSVMRLHRLDAVVAPTGSPAWPIELINGDHFLGASSTPAAVAGYPNVTVPMGNVYRLPIGISFIGTAWSEPTLLRLAYGFEQATRHRRPPRFLPTVDLQAR